MVKFTLTALLALLLAMAACITPAEAADDEPFYWQLAIETGLNSDENIESRVIVQLKHWDIEIEGRQSDYANVDVFKRWHKSHLKYSDGTQYEITVNYLLGHDLRHGPVLNYTDLGDEDETTFVGYRVWWGTKP